jgi:hypothetical protein
VKVSMLRQYLGLSSPKKRSELDLKGKNKAHHKTKRQRTIIPGWKTEFH